MPWWPRGEARNFCNCKVSRSFSKLQVQLAAGPEDKFCNCNVSRSFSKLRVQLAAGPEDCPSDLWRRSRLLRRGCFLVLNRSLLIMCLLVLVLYRPLLVNFAIAKFLEVFQSCRFSWQLGLRIVLHVRYRYEIKRDRKLVGIDRAPIPIIVATITRVLEYSSTGCRKLNPNCRPGKDHKL
jgi:hypothetical protein